MSKIVTSCTKLWLPLPDEKMEGFWENTNKGTNASLLKWADGQPNGLRVQNHAALYIETLDFGDFVSGALECVSCKLSTMAVLTLRGVCKDSYLGKKFGQTRPKPAYGRQGLDSDRWARIQFSQKHETTLKNHGNQPKTMKLP